MTDQIKISASLQDAQAYMAECLEFVTQDEPFVLDFNDSFGSYVQAVRDDIDQICVEISGPESIAGELSPEVADKLLKLGWGLPRQPEADTPNFWREYPEDADLKQIAKDAIIGVAVAFPDAKFIGGFVDPVMSMDEASELLEQGKKVFVQEVAEEPLPKKKVRIHSAWQNYREAKYRCSACAALTAIENCVTFPSRPPMSRLSSLQPKAAQRRLNTSRYWPPIQTKPR